MAALTIILIPLISHDLFADEKAELTGDRPYFTESAQTVPYQSAQFETGYTYTSSSNTDEHTLGELLVRLGLLRPLEIRVGINSYVWNEEKGGSRSGKDEGYIGLKLELLQSPGSFRLMKPDLALIAGTSLPTGSDVSIEDYEPEATIAISWPLARAFELGTNISWAAPVDSGERYAMYSASITLGISLADRIGMYGEYYGFYPYSMGSDPGHYINGGMTCLITDKFQLDLRAGSTVSGPVEEYYFGAGAIALFTRLL